MITDITRLTLIDKVQSALNSRNVVELKAAQDLLKTKCNQAKIAWLTFLVDEVLPKRNSPFKIESVLPSDCPYCERTFGNTTGLKAHLGRKHQDKKRDWSLKI